MGGAVSRTGYVVECPLTPGNCQPMRGDSSGDDLLLYDTAGDVGGWEGERAVRARWMGGGE